MKIGIILNWMNPNMIEMARLLDAHGATLELIYPEKQMIDLGNLQVRNDLYLIKSAHDLSLSYAGALHNLGAAMLNPYPAVTMLQNKIVSTRVLQEAGVPTPETYVTADPNDLVPLLQQGPLILKPYLGCCGEGIAIVRDAAELSRVAPKGTIMAQRYYQSDDGHDQKVFCIGTKFFGVRRVFPLRSYADKKGEPFTLSPEVRQIAQRCAMAIGLDLFGMDVVVSGGRPYVVDVNKFPGYMGVPNAARLLADHVLATARRVLRGEPLLSAAGGTLSRQNTGRDRWSASLYAAADSGRRTSPEGAAS